MRSITAFTLTFNAKDNSANQKRFPHAYKHVVEILDRVGIICVEGENGSVQYVNNDDVLQEALKFYDVPTLLVFACLSPRINEIVNNPSNKNGQAIWETYWMRDFKNIIPVPNNRETLKAQYCCYNTLTIEKVIGMFDAILNLMKNMNSIMHYVYSAFDLRCLIKQKSFLQDCIKKMQLNPLDPTLLGTIDEHIKMAIQTIRQSGNSGLFIAAHIGHEPLVRLMLEDGSINVNALFRVSGYQRTPLMQAAYENHPKVVSLLIENPRVDPHMTNSFESATALSVARMRGHQAIVDILTAHEANLQAQTNNNNNNNNNNAIESGKKMKIT